MRVLLINPPIASYYHRLGLKYPPLGVGYIAGSLVKAGYNVKVIDLNVEKIDIKSIPYYDFDIVGISTDTTRYPMALKIAQIAKSKGCRVVIGGPHTTFLDKETLETGFIDYVVRGEYNTGPYGFTQRKEKDRRGKRDLIYKRWGYYKKSRCRTN